ncbi:MAG: zf-HC2 domain-containing protein [Candidatus Rokubacteria bacterium]|nr:zf-HC2 domain-containing protein [Candidatus Rokubacteria bacterium]
MTCADVRETFLDLQDGTLAPDEHRAVDEHLSTCAACRRELDRYRATVSLLGRVDRARAPVGFADRVVGAARPVPWHRRVTRQLLFPLPVKLPAEAAAIVLVAIGVVYVFQKTPELQHAARIETLRPEREVLTPSIATAPVTRSADAPGPPPAPAAPPTSSSSAPVRSAPPAAPPSAVPPPTTGAAPSAEAPLRPPAESPGTSAGKVDTAPAQKPAKSETSAARERREPESATHDDLSGAASRQQAVAPADVPPRPDTAPPARRAEPPAAEPSRAPGPDLAKDAREQRAPRSGAPPDEELTRRRGDLSAPPSEAVQGVAPPAPSRLAAKAPAPDVTGRLSARDPREAERAIRPLASRHGGAVVARHIEGGTVVIELTLPRNTYRRFIADLASVGSWRPEHERGDLPDQIRLAIRVE